jgi:GTP cyclohydrolase I
VPFVATTFPNDEGYDELVLARDIPFHSLCMHHMLPVPGRRPRRLHPGERIVGLSKLARVVESFSRDLQVQERLTVQVASWLEETLQPKGVGVVLEAEHTCMALRGVRKPGSRTVTSALRGAPARRPRAPAPSSSRSSGSGDAAHAHAHPGGHHGHVHAPSPDADRGKLALALGLSWASWSSRSSPAWWRARIACSPTPAHMLTEREPSRWR